MYVPFDQLPDEARIWIYPSNRKMSEEEVDQIKALMADFLQQWTAHGQNLNAGFELPHNRFIVIGLDQSNAAASGCSIDASVHFIQEIEKKFDLVLLDKMNVTYYNGPHIAHKSLADFKAMAKARSVSPRTVVFNNLVTTKEEYRDHWEVPASESWHARFLG